MEESVPQTWSELRQLVLDISDRNDVGLTSHYGIRLIAAAEDSGELDMLASAWFTWGIALDNIGQLEEAEQAFTKALKYDMEFHGPHHVAIADVRRSLGMVQRKHGGGKNWPAVDNFAEASKLYAELNPSLVADVEIRRGEALLELSEIEKATEAFQMAFYSGDRFSGPASDVTLLALNNLGLAYQGSEDYQAAFGTYSEVTRRGRYGVDGTRLQHVASAWLQLARLSKWPFQTFPQALISYGFATLLGKGKIKETASKEAREIRGRKSTDFSHDSWLLTYHDSLQRVGHVAHPFEGLWVFHGDSPGLPGQPVSVHFDANLSPIVSPRRRNPDGHGGER